MRTTLRLRVQSRGKNTFCQYCVSHSSDANTIQTGTTQQPTHTGATRKKKTKIYITDEVKRLSPWRRVAVGYDQNPFPLDLHILASKLPRRKSGLFEPWPLCFSKEPEQNILCEMKFLFSASLPCSKRRRERRAWGEESAALCWPPWMSPSNASYPSRRKCWETWETFIFNTAFPNLITSAIRRCCHENELAEGSAGVVTCSVCLGRPEDGKETLLELAWNSISFFFSRLWQVSGRRLCPCQCASVKKRTPRPHISLRLCVCARPYFLIFPTSAAAQLQKPCPDLHLYTDHVIQKTRLSGMRPYLLGVLRVTCFGRQPELVGKRWSHTQTERWEAAHGLV